MELRQMKYFLVVAEELHFGRAAARLHISQPPLTVHIKKLEEELGVVLFDRTSRRVSLTSAGVRFQDRARVLLRELEDTVDDVREVHRGRRGRVRVGFVSSASYQLVPTVVQQMRERQPGIHVELYPMATGEQMEALQDGLLDVGIMRDAPVESGLTFTTLVTEEMVAVLPSSHALADQRMVRAEDLRDVPMVLFPYQSMPGYVTSVLDIFHDIGHSPDVVQRAVNQENVMGLVAAGVGASILPESFSGFSFPGVVTRPIAQAPKTRLEMVTNLGPASTISQTFISVLKDAAAEVQFNQLQSRSSRSALDTGSKDQN